MVKEKIPNEFLHHCNWIQDTHWILYRFNQKTQPPLHYDGVDLFMVPIQLSQRIRELKLDLHQLSMYGGNNEGKLNTPNKQKRWSK